MLKLLKLLVRKLKQHIFVIQKSQLVKSQTLEIILQSHGKRKYKIEIIEMSIRSKISYLFRT